MHELRDLDGFNVVRGVAESGEPPSLTIFGPSGVSVDGKYSAAESMHVQGLEALSTLLILTQGLIEEHIRQTAKAGFPPLIPVGPVVDSKLGVRL